MLLGIGVGGHERSADSRVEVGQARSIHSVAKPTARVANPAVLASSPNIHPSRLICRLLPQIFAAQCLVAATYAILT